MTLIIIISQIEPHPYSYIAEMGNSQSIVECEGLPYVEESHILKKKGEDYWKENCEVVGFDPYKQICKWEVFLLIKDEVMLAFKNAKGKCFCTYLFVDIKENERENYFNFGVIDLASHKRKQSLGFVRMSAEDILHVGYKILLDNFRDYHLLIGNSQEFCRELAKELGCDDGIIPIADISTEITREETIRCTYYVLTEPILSF
jgi:hypothetical protein